MEKGLHYVSKRIYLGEADVEVNEKGDFLDTEENDGKPHLLYEFWVEDISRYKKAVILKISYHFLGTREQGSFFISDAFVNEIAISRKKADQEKNYRWEYEVCATSEMLPFVRKTIKRQLKEAGLDNHFSCRIDFMQAYITKLQDEEHYVLSVKEMTKAAAVYYLPCVFSREVFGLRKDDYEKMLSDANKIVICEVSPDGSANNIFKRMRYAIDSLNENSKDVIYYIEAGNPYEAHIINPDSSTLSRLMENRYNVIKYIWGENMEVAKRYTKAVVCLIVHN